MSLNSLAENTGVRLGVLEELLGGLRAVDAETDLRLCRFFRLTDGFWLRLQDAHDLLEARRKIQADLDRIRPYAA